MDTNTPIDRHQPPTDKPGSAWLSDREVRAVVGALRRLSHACEELGNTDPDHLAEAIRLDELATRIKRRAGASPRKAFVIGLDPRYGTKQGATRMTTLIRATLGLQAVHAERPDIVLEIVAQAWVPTAGDAWPCVLTDRSGAWYAAEVAYAGDRLVAYAVTSHTDETAARMDARRRWHAESAQDPVRGYRTNEHSRRSDGRTED